MKNKLAIEKQLTAILLLFFSVSMGFFLEALRYHAVCYYQSIGMDMPSLTRFVLSIHSEPENLFPKHPTFVIMMLIPCLLTICINYKRFYTSKNELKLFIHSFLCLIFNLTLAILIIIIIADPIYKLGILAYETQKYSDISLFLLITMIILALTCVILLTRAYFAKRTRAKS